jgi:hypothetical protein
LNTNIWFFVGEGAGGYLAAAAGYDLDNAKVFGIVNFFGITEWDLYLDKHADLKYYADILPPYMGGK